MSDVAPGVEPQPEPIEKAPLPIEGQGPPPTPDPEPVFQPGEELPAIVCDAAFLVFQDPSGHWIAETNFARPVVAKRPSTLIDIGHAAGEIERDILAHATASQVVGLQQQVAQQMAQQMAAQQEAAGILQGVAGGPGGGVDLSKLRK